MDQRRIRDLFCRVQSLLDRYYQRCAEAAGVVVESMITSDAPLIKEMWCWMKVWYNTTTNLPLPPNCVTLEQIAAEWVALYKRVPPPPRG